MTTDAALTTPPPRPAPARTTRAPAPRIRLTPKARKSLVVLHVVVSVAILGQVWANAVLAATAMADPDAARTVYRLMDVLIFASAAPLSMLALVSGIVLGLGTKWGVLRFRWVVAKLVLLVGTVATGIAVQGPLIEDLLAQPTPQVQGIHLAVTGLQFVMLVAATWLSVFKPGGRMRRSRR